MSNHDAKVWQEVLRWLQFARDDLDVALMESAHPAPLLEVMRSDRNF